MARTYLFPTSPPSPSVTGVLTNATTYAVAFTPTADVYVQSLRWYRAIAGSTNFPIYLALWDVASTQPIIVVPNPPDTGSIGWQEVFITNDVKLISGAEYRMSIYYGVGGQAPYTATSGTPGTNLAWASTIRRFLVGSFGFPANTNAGVEFELSDVGVDTTPPSAGTTPVTTTTQNDLASWLITTGDNQHQTDGLPWRTDANVTTVKGEAEGASGFAAIKAVADAIAAVVSGLPGTIASALTTITGQLTTMTGNVAQTGIATIGSISHDLASVEKQLINGLFGKASFPGGSSGATWTLAAEADFTQDVAINTPADLYVITFTTLPPGFTDIDVAGVHWHPRLAWAAELNGTHLAFRQFLDFENNQVWSQEHRLQGLLVHGKPGTLGHWQAWTLG